MNLNEIIIKDTGVISQNNCEHIWFRSFSINSKAIASGDIFVGLIGEKFDGNSFYQSALENGASAVIFDSKSKFFDPAKIDKKVSYLVVDDCLAFLQRIAKKHIENWKLKGGQVVCITGSNGKTTTKEMTSHLLEKIYPGKVIATEGNLNNHIGVPLTLLRVQPFHHYAIVEIGTNAPGEIKFLAEIAKPDFGIITSIGESHLEKLVNIEGVLNEKTSLFDYINKVSVKPFQCFYIDNPIFEKRSVISNSFKIKIGDNLKKYNNSSFELFLKPNKVKIENENIIGDYNFYNLSLAVSICLRLGCVAKKLEEHLKSFVPKLSRSEWKVIEGKNFFCDFYNANPSSMKNALTAFIDNLRDKTTLERMLFVIGDMYELGENSPNFHKEIGKFLANIGPLNVIYVGKFAKYFLDGFGMECKTFQESSDFCLFDLLDQNITHVFIKASRGVGLEKILNTRQ